MPFVMHFVEINEFYNQYINELDNLVIMKVEFFSQMFFSSNFYIYLKNFKHLI